MSFIEIIYISQNWAIFHGLRLCNCSWAATGFTLDRWWPRKWLSCYYIMPKTNIHHVLEAIHLYSLHPSYHTSPHHPPKPRQKCGEGDWEDRNQDHWSAILCPTKIANPAHQQTSRSPLHQDFVSAWQDRWIWEWRQCYCSRVRNGKRRGNNI